MWLEPMRSLRRALALPGFSAFPLSGFRETRSKQESEGQLQVSALRQTGSILNSGATCTATDVHCFIKSKKARQLPDVCCKLASAPVGLAWAQLGSLSERSRDIRM